MRSLGLRNEVDVLDRTFLKSDSPVRRIVPNRRRDREGPWQLRVNLHLGPGVQQLDKVPLILASR